MVAHDESRTSISLLRRVALFPRDEAAWGEFVNRYGKKILKWCCDRGLQDADALDVSQIVLERLAVRLRCFVYDPFQSFRGFLRKMTSDAVCDAIATRARVGASGASDSVRLLADIEARDDLIGRLEKEFDLEILDEATRTVRQKVMGHTWDAYHLTTEKGLSGAQAAAQLGISVERVFVGKGRVLKMLQKEVHRLESH